MAGDDDDVYDQYFSGDEHAPEIADGGADDDEDDAPATPEPARQFAPPPWEAYRRYYGKSLAVGFLPAFLFVLTGMGDYWWGLLAAGVLVAVGATETDNATLKRVVGQPLVFSLGLLAGLALGFGFVELGIAFPSLEVPAVGVPASAPASAVVPLTHELSHRG